MADSAAGGPFARDVVIIGGCGRVGLPLGVAFASQRWGAEQRPGMSERHPERTGERWAIR